MMKMTEMLINWFWRNICSGWFKNSSLHVFITLLIHPCFPAQLFKVATGPTSIKLWFLDNRSPAARSWAGWSDFDKKSGCFCVMAHSVDGQKI